MKAFIRLAAVFAASSFSFAPALAQTGSASAPAHHGLLHQKKTAGAQSGKPVHAGSIIGNKNTHVYHMKGDPGRLPDPENRVYFRTEAQAIAAGYRRAGHRSDHHPKTGAHKGHKAST